MRRVRNRIIPTRSASPAAPRNSPQRRLCHFAASAHESLAPANPFPCRSLPKLAPSNPPAPRGPPSRKRAASLPSGRSSGRIALRSSNAASGRHFLFQVWPATSELPRAGAALPVRNLSPSSRRRQAAGLRLPFSPCPAPRPSAPALRFPDRASSAETIARPVPAARRPAAPSPVACWQALLAPLRPNPPPRSDIWLPAPSAARILPPVRHPQSRWSLSFFPYIHASLLPYFIASSNGSVTQNRVPCPLFAGLTQSNRPPNSATRLATIAKPNPVPCDLVVKNGCRIFSRTAAGIPCPSSSTAMIQAPSFEAADTMTCPPRGVASRAFTTRLDTMSFTASALAATVALSPETLICIFTPRRSASCDKTPATSSTATRASQLPMALPPRTAGRLNCNS